MRRLAGNRNPRWAIWERFEIPDYDSDQGNYLTRLRVIQTPWFAVYLHRMDGPDSRPTLHDHPWRFWSFVLRGGYIERRLNTHTMQVDENHIVRHLNRVGTHDAHAITDLLRTPTWTLLLVGPRIRTWGYWEPEFMSPRALYPWRWRWTEYDKHPHATEFDAALARRTAAAR